MTASTRILIALLIAVASAPAQEKSPWTVDDIVLQESARSWTLSRDGRRALWVRGKPGKEKDRSVSTLMLLDVESGRSRALTVGQDGVSSPAFSPDGTRVTYTTRRAFPAGMKGPAKDQAGSQIWILELEGGEARPLTDIPFGVSSYAWHDDTTIYLVARERRTRAEQKTTDDKDKTIVVEDTVAFRDGRRRLFRFDVSKKKLVRVTSNEDRISRFVVSPDGKWVVTMHDRHPAHRAEELWPPRCLVTELATGTTREVFGDRKHRPARLAWRRDSSAFYAVYPRSTVDGEDWAATRILKSVSVPDLAVSDVPLEWERGLTFGFSVTADGFVTGLCDGVRPKVARYVHGDGGWRRELLSGAHAGRISSIVLSRDSDRVIYIHGGASDPDHVVAARLDGSRLVDEKEVFRPNGGFAKKNIAKTEIIRWTGALDEEVEGILYYPHDWTEGERRPLVLITHGGPHGADRDRFSERWSNSPNMYCQRGAFVLKTNYHGSSDYGLAFGESIRHRYYELEVKDMFAGIEKLVAEGKVDPEQMGLVGWSNGAILSVACLTLAHLYAPEYDWKFKACAPGAGDVNWTSDYGNCAFGVGFDDFYLGGPPWKIPDVYLKKSPLFHVERVTTPTIIFFGSEDTSVPTEQGWQWYRALRKAGKAPVRFLLFPGEGHGLSKITHQRRKLTEELAWMDEHMFEKKVPADVVKKGSPLAMARARSGFPAWRGRWGVRHEGKLVPETVPFADGVEVGRFEVTRAQWAQFTGGSPSVGSVAHGNRPRTGIDLSAARRYVEWLSRVTGEAWRLPTSAESKRITSVKGSSENTLDWWAGYSPAEDDAVALRGQLAELGTEVVLQPAGSRPGGTHRHRGREVLLFDAGGNVAELAVGEDGEAAVHGGWALGTDDGRSGTPEVPADWIGLRVMKGPVPKKD